MHFHSIIVATLTLTVSTVLAAEPNCFKWCKAERDVCPPEAPPKQLSDVCLEPICALII